MNDSELMNEKETVTLEKKVYDVLLKRNADLIDENEELEEENRRLQKELNESIDQNKKNVYDVLVQAARGANYALNVVKNLEAEKEKLKQAIEIYREALSEGLRATGLQDSFWEIVSEADEKAKKLLKGV